METGWAGAEAVEVEEEGEGAGCWRGAEECHKELKWHWRCSSGGPGSSRLSPLRQRRTRAGSLDSSSARPPGA